MPLLAVPSTCTARSAAPPGPATPNCVVLPAVAGWLPAESAPSFGRYGGESMSGPVGLVLSRMNSHTLPPLSDDHGPVAVPSPARTFHDTTTFSGRVGVPELASARL